MLKIFLLIVVAAALYVLAAMPAAATTLCKVTTDPCPMGSEYGVGQAITGSLTAKTASLFSTENGTASCQKATLKLTTSATSGAPLKGSATTWAFNEAECKYVATNEKCERAESLDLPYAVEIEATGGGGGNLKMQSSGNGPPKVWYSCVGSFNCVFQKTEVVLSVASTGTAIATAKNLSFTKFSGFTCPLNPALWSAEYDLSPSPLYIAAKP